MPATPAPSFADFLATFGPILVACALVVSSLAFFHVWLRPHGPMGRDLTLPEAFTVGMLTIGVVFTLLELYRGVSTLVLISFWGLTVTAIVLAMLFYRDGDDLRPRPVTYLGVVGTLGVAWTILVLAVDTGNWQAVADYWMLTFAGAVPTVALRLVQEAIDNRRRDQIERSIADVRRDIDRM